MPGAYWLLLIPPIGKLRLERWFASPDPDIRWMMRENLKKARLYRMDAEWVTAWQAKL